MWVIDKFVETHKNLVYNLNNKVH